MIAWLRHHALGLLQTLSRLARTPLGTLFNVLAIGVALALPLGGYIVLANLDSLSRNFPAEPQLSVFLSRDAGKDDVAAVEARLKRSEGVRAVRFVGRDIALAELKRAPGMAEVIDALRDNPLPDAFVITLASGDTGLSQRLEREFRALRKVAHVQADAAWARRIEALVRLGRTGVVLLGGLFSFALLAVTFNTIRLQILTQRDEIEVSRLIGATRAYVRRPFLYLGALLGLAGGAAALAMVFAALAALNLDLGQLGTLYGTDLRLRFPAPLDSAAVLAFSCTLGWLGSYLSVSKHLREIDNG